MKALASIALAACHGGASPELGLESLLLVDGAQFRPGPFPPDDGGPAAIELSTGHAQVIVGRVGEPINGKLDPVARGCVLGLDGVDGTWLLPAQAPDQDTPTLPSAHATFSLAEDFLPGPFTLVLAASDAGGRFGAAVSTEVVAEPEDPPAGELVVELVWEGAADLDIHVVEPGMFGGEAFADHPSTLDPPPGTTVSPTEFLEHGLLDHDGNKECRRLGHPTEHVIWTMPPPAGDYVVRVDAPSLCGDASATWFVTAYRTTNGVTEIVGAARGISTPDDVLQPRGKGAGVLALRFAL